MTGFLKNLGRHGISGLVAALVAFVTVAAPSQDFHSWFHEEVSSCSHDARQPASDPASEDPSQHNHGLLTLLSSGQFALLADVQAIPVHHEADVWLRLVRPDDILPLTTYGLLPSRGPPVLV